MPRALSSTSLGLLITVGADRPLYGHLVTQLPKGSRLLERNHANSLFEIHGGYVILEGEEGEDLYKRVVALTELGWEYLSIQGFESKAGPGEDDGLAEDSFPPHLPPVLDDFIQDTQVVNPSIYGRIVSLDDVMECLWTKFPSYDLASRPAFRKRMGKLMAR